MINSTECLFHTVNSFPDYHSLAELVVLLFPSELQCEQFHSCRALASLFPLFQIASSLSGSWATTPPWDGCIRGGAADNLAKADQWCADRRGPWGPGHGGAWAALYLFSSGVNPPWKLCSNPSCPPSPAFPPLA